MIPFLSKKKYDGNAGLIIKTREPDESPEQNDSSAGIESCADELIRAVHARDSKAVANALKDAFDILESGEESIEPHSYDAQNIKAGEQE